MDVQIHCVDFTLIFQPLSRVKFDPVPADSYTE